MPSSERLLPAYGVSLCTLCSTTFATSSSKILPILFGVSTSISNKELTDQFKKLLVKVIILLAEVYIWKYVASN